MVTTLYLVMWFLLLTQIRSFVFRRCNTMIKAKFRPLQSSNLKLWKNEMNTLVPTNKFERNLYGRVPYDDWLFTNWKLTDPNLYRKTFLEAIASEIPNAVKHQSRRKLASNIISLVGSSFVLLLALPIIMSIIYGKIPNKNERPPPDPVKIRGVYNNATHLPAHNIAGTDYWYFGPKQYLTRLGLDVNETAVLPEWYVQGYVSLTDYKLAMEKLNNSAANSTNSGSDGRNDSGLRLNL